MFVGILFFEKCEVKVQAAAFNEKRINLAVSCTKKLKINSSGWTSKNTIWKSSDEAVVTVSNNGKITANAIGSATIKAKKGKTTLKCKVYVSNPILTSEKLNKFIDEECQLDVTGELDKKVTWSSDNENVVTVSADGLVKAIEPGTTNIVAKVDGKTLKCVFTEVIPKLNSVYYQAYTKEFSTAKYSVKLDGSKSAEDFLVNGKRNSNYGAGGKVCGTYTQYYDMTEADFSDENVYAVYETYTKSKSTSSGGNRYTDIYIVGTAQTPEVRTEAYLGSLDCQYIPNDAGYGTLRVYTYASDIDIGAAGIINLKFGEYIYNIAINSRGTPYNEAFAKIPSSDVDAKFSRTQYLRNC